MKNRLVRRTALRWPDNIKDSSSRQRNSCGALLRLVPVILAVFAAVILPSPAVCGDTPGEWGQVFTFDLLNRELAWAEVKNQDLTTLP